METISQFQKKVYTYYETYGRDLPWRKADDPYAVLVSEVMLQQTQVDRVIPKYTAFLGEFPSFEHLAQASKAEVLSIWSGLGYNRRGLNLQKAAAQVMLLHGGRLPSDHRLLDDLPGIGPATASSIQAFAFNLPSVFIETNIRSVFIYEFFSKRAKVSDAELLPLVARYLDTQNPKKWYNALMDYGTMLKKTIGNPSRKSLSHNKQSPFAGSNRQLRGAILKLLLSGGVSESDLLSKLTEFDGDRVRLVLETLMKEAMIEKVGATYMISERQQ